MEGSGRWRGERALGNPRVRHYTIHLFLAFLGVRSVKLGLVLGFVWGILGFVCDFFRVIEQLQPKIVGKILNRRQQNAHVDNIVDNLNFT